MERLAGMVMMCSLTTCVACSHATRRPASPTTEQRSLHCDIAAAALRALVRPNREQPLGLEKECVEKRTMRDGRIYVDARFTNGEQLEDTEVSSCERDQYLIRFDWKGFVPSPTGHVVLLLFNRKSDGELTFNAVTEDSDWPGKASGVFGLSQCGASFGNVQLESGRWRAQLTMPPQAGTPF